MGNNTLVSLSTAFSGRYTIQRELGRGGMASVYLGHDVKHDRNVAIKVLHAEVAAAIGTERFLREIRIASRLTHPHILPLHDSGELQIGPRSLLYYVMPFVEGESLRQRLDRETRLSIDDALRIAREVAGALEYAHANDVIHRDIKPENILLEAGHAVVADFGVAHADVGNEERLTRTGSALGTPGYMSPEQALGSEAADARTDIYALGCVLYEMLAGQPPYTGESIENVVRQHVTGEVPSITQHRRNVPARVSGAITRALAKSPADRFESASAFANELEPPVVPAARTRRRRIAIATAIVVLVAAGAAFARPARKVWAQLRVLPQLEAQIERGDLEAAYRLSGRLTALLPQDSVVNELRASLVDVLTIEAAPPGTQVWRAAYGATDGWELVGTAPGDVVMPRYPLISQLRLEAPGHAPLYTVAIAGGSPFRRVPIRAPLLPDTVATGDMLLVGGGRVVPGIMNFDPAESADIPDFLLGRYEVTNAEYQVFVDSGGYRREEFWTDDFVDNGSLIAFDDAMSRFVDRTGRPGPATWEAGRYPRDQPDHPVSGVSWYEAMAYARFRGARLPDLFEWTRAARFWASNVIVPASNIDRVSGGTAPVGSYGGMSGSGAYDMAGNVREWAFNESRTRSGRYILGGGWNDPGYLFFEAAIHPPLDRSATNGIRLARDADAGVNGVLLASDVGTAAGEGGKRPVEPVFRDYRTERPVSDETFAIYRRMFLYDPVPLDARIERSDTSARWINQKITFNAAYGGERVTARLFLPINAQPPYETVLFYPGAGALTAPSSDSLRSMEAFDFLVDAGRAVVYPVLKGTYERRTDLAMTDPESTSRYRDHVIMWQQDVTRTLDYLSTRADVDTARFGYIGFSWGGRLSGVILSTEPRFKAAVLNVAGLSFRRPPPEVDDFSYMPRVRVPVLMINGRHDNTFPLETSARPMFELLGTPADRKRLEVVDGVHLVPRNELIRVTFEWFDRYLSR